MESLKDILNVTVSNQNSSLALTKVSGKSRLRKTVTLLAITLLLISMFALLIKPVATAGTITIMSDGSIYPSSAPISNFGGLNSLYVFNGAITDSIVIQRDNIVLNGAGFSLTGTGTGIGISLTSRTGVTVKNVKITDFDTGISLTGSYGNTLYGNLIISCITYGIYLASSSNSNNIYANTLTINYFGIYLAGGSSSNTISANTIASSTYGILLASSNSNIISSNTVNNCVNDGVILTSSNGNSVCTNTVMNTQTYDGIFVLSYSSTNSIYQNTLIANHEAGICIACSGNSIFQNTITNSVQYGIFLTTCSGNSISQNCITDNPDGIYIYNNANGNTVSSNTITKSTTYGIYFNIAYGNDVYSNNIAYSSASGVSLRSASGNILSQNAITYSTSSGVFLDVSASNNCILANTLAYNGYGISTGYSVGNYVFHNNIEYNTVQAYAIAAYPNTWNDGYPSGGNYWSDYTGTDQYKGSSQNLAGPDGLGDTSYSAATNNVDNYPLMGPWAASSLASKSMAVVGRATDNSIWYRVFTGSAWSNSYSIAASTIAQPAAAIFQGKLYIAAIASTNNIWWCSIDLTTGLSSDWQLFAGSNAASVSLSAYADRLVCTARGLDNSIWYRTYNGVTWGGWANIAGGGTTIAPSTAIFSDKLYIAAIGGSGDVWLYNVNLQSGVVSGWSLYQPNGVASVVLSSSATRLVCTVRGTDNSIWFRSSSDASTWTDWSKITGSTTVQPTAAVYDGKLYVGTVGTGNSASWSSTDLATKAFTDWTQWSGNTALSVTLTSTGT